MRSFLRRFFPVYLKSSFSWQTFWLQKDDIASKIQDHRNKLTQKFELLVIFKHLLGLDNQVVLLLLKHELYIHQRHQFHARLRSIQKFASLCFCIGQNHGTVEDWTWFFTTTTEMSSHSHALKDQFFNTFDHLSRREAEELCLKKWSSHGES